ncbi:hypothetical protein FACS1894190_12180 [Spirochaetia bacterium]|nr:hypothetical protein FACS1894190_12180 [Spirochaetia bacterium]
MVNKDYSKLDFKIPIEAQDYRDCSDFVVGQIKSIVDDAIKNKKNKIIINTNLKLGLPMENINKVAGPFVEAWAVEIFTDVLEDENNKYDLINVEAGERLNMADIILQFKRNRKQQSSVTGFVDVKATSNDIKGSGKSPNITSFARIRTEYVKDPDYLFVILSIKHKVYSHRDKASNMMFGVMEAVDFNAYDLKFLGKNDISYNLALGSGQLQVRDIHYVSQEIRTTWEFCQLLDAKCIASRKGFSEWLRYAKQNNWIKDE